MPVSFHKSHCTCQYSRGRNIDKNVWDFFIPVSQREQYYDIFFLEVFKFLVFNLNMEQNAEKHIRRTWDEVATVGVTKCF